MKHVKPRPAIIIGVIVEIFLFIVIFFLLVLGMVGVLLPVFPGLVLVGAAAAIYSLMVRSRFTVVTPRLNRYVMLFKRLFTSNKYIIRIILYMHILKKRYQQKFITRTLIFGLSMLGLNSVMVLSIIFCFIAWTNLSQMLNVEEALLAGFIAIIFVFSGLSAVIWYRIGQMMGKKYGSEKVKAAFTSVFISLLPLLLMTMIAAEYVRLNEVNEVYNALLLGLYGVTVLASILQFFIVYLGMITKK